MAAEKETIFRKKAIERISSPDQLTDYLRVTSPGIWMVLAVTILLLGSLFSWASIGTLETTAQVKVVVRGHEGRVIPVEGAVLAAGMELGVSGMDTVIASADTDEYGRSVGIAEIALPDGVYDGAVVIEAIHPIRFLIESR